MLPMVTELGEIAQAREIIDREVRHLSRFGHHLPTSLKLGAMLEVPSLLWQLDELMDAVDFVSVGSNDLFQFVMATDRGNTQLADRFDPLSVPFLRVLQQIADAGERNGTPVTLCGELAGKPISAMALIGDRLPLDLDVAGVDRSGQGDADRAAARAQLKAFLDDDLPAPTRGRQHAERGCDGLRRTTRRCRCNVPTSHDQPAPRPDGPARQAFRHARSADVGRAGAGSLCEAGLRIFRARGDGGARSARCAPPRRSSPISRRCSPTRRPTATCGRWPRPSCPTVEERIEALQQRNPDPAAAEGRGRREATPSSKSAPAPAATRRRLFAGDLFRMYERYAAASGWKVEVVSASEGEVGGYKEIIATVSGKGVFAKLKFESGVHRVQRVPATEAQRPHPHLGRDRRGAAGGRGGRHRDPRRGHPHRHDARLRRRRPARQHHRFGRAHHPSADRHRGDAGRRSRSTRTAPRAMQILRARLYDMERSRADEERSESRKPQVGSGDRSERIRTYNFPQGRVTDHRINLTLYKLDRVMMGELDEIVDALIADHQSQAARRYRRRWLTRRTHARRRAARVAQAAARRSRHRRSGARCAADRRAFLRHRPRAMRSPRRSGRSTPAALARSRPP